MGGPTRSQRNRNRKGARRRKLAKKSSGCKRRVVDDCLAGRLRVDRPETLHQTYDRFKRPEDPHLSLAYFVEAMRLGEVPSAEFTAKCILDESPFDTPPVDAALQVGGGDDDGAGPSDRVYKQGMVADGEALLRSTDPIEELAEDREERFFYHAVGDDNPDYVPDHIYRSATTGRAYGYKPDTQHIRNGDTTKSIPERAPAELGFDDLWVDPYAEGGHMLEEVSEEHRASFDDFLQHELEPLAKARPAVKPSLAAKRNDPNRVIAITKHADEAKSDAPTYVDDAADIGACPYPTMTASLTRDYQRHLLTCGQEGDFQRACAWIESRLNNRHRQSQGLSLRGLVNELRLHSAWPYSIDPRPAANQPRHYVLGVKFNTIEDEGQNVILNELGDGSETHFQTRDSVVGYTTDCLGGVIVLGVDQNVADEEFAKVDSITKAAASRLAVIIISASFAPMV